MRDSSKEIIVRTTKVHVPSHLKSQFIDWHSKMNEKITAFPGFVSFEVLSPNETSPDEWIIVQRFATSKAYSQWNQSKEYQALQTELSRLLGTDHIVDIQDVNSTQDSLSKGVMEIFVTQVTPGMEKRYREWLSTIQQMEASFPGFRGVSEQSHQSKKGPQWITLLQFDNQEHLDQWIASPERARILKEGRSFFTSFESHRIISPYAGWFTSLAKGGEVPPVWKQTLLVLLVLFPIVMFEMKYLSPLTSHLNHSLANFIGNALSVTLISWPLMPLTIRCLNWWLLPNGNKKTTLLGTVLIFVLYFVEIAAFWNFL